METKRVLIVDDSPTMRQLLAFALKRLPGVVISEAANGVDGLKKITGERFDLIFTDINMPVMDGLKLVSLVRKDAALNNIPIVVISTEGAEEDRNRAFALGANDYITKPVQSPQVQEVARRLLVLK
ncbi:response regulator [Desulfuromonas acetexigens]|uniref:Response regulator n=1 Tax=Trichloromonas acetexigens TaxID=38815 RepID=A0A550JKU3_9BACT|nr:response regulator [Desulfuromonas acetexigens]TRO83830.1 response regulator [Desulfuromonas acetexigens]